MVLPWLGYAFVLTLTFLLGILGGEHGLIFAIAGFGVLMAHLSYPFRPAAKIYFVVVLAVMATWWWRDEAAGIYLATLLLLSAISYWTMYSLIRHIKNRQRVRIWD